MTKIVVVSLLLLAPALASAGWYSGSGRLTSHGHTSSSDGGVIGDLLLSGDQIRVNGVTYTWPGSDGSSGQYLRTNGAAGLSWATSSGSGVTEDSSPTWSGSHAWISSPTFRNHAFSVGGSTLSIANGITTIATLNLSNALGLAYGGTGATSASGARTSLGLVIGSDVQAFDSDLSDLADGSLTGSKVGDGVPAANVAAGSLDVDVIASSIAVNAVHTAAIQDNAVTGAKIAAGTITGANVDTSSFTMLGSSVTYGEVKEVEDSFTVTITSGTGWDNQAFVIGRAPRDRSFTILEVYAETLPAGTSVQYQLEERAAGSVNSAGTAVFTVTNSTANGTGVSETSFANAGIAARAALVLDTDSAAATGAAEQITVTVYYRRDD